MQACEAKEKRESASAPHAPRCRGGCDPGGCGGERRQRLPSGRRSGGQRHSRLRQLQDAQEAASSD